MTIKYLIDNIDLEACQEPLAWDEYFFQEFDLDTYNLDCNSIFKEEKLKEHHYYKWLCTDTHVGYSLYSYNGQVVAWSKQTSRKSDKQFQWVSIELYNEVRTYVESFINKEDMVSNVFIIDMDTEIPDKVTVEYSGGLLTNNSPLFCDETNQELKLIKAYTYYDKDVPQGLDQFRSIIVEYPNKEQKTLTTSDVYQKYPLKKKS